MADYLGHSGLRVLRRSVKAPYDLLINGQVRVDVKIGRFTSHRRGVEGYIFCLHKVPPTCDLYLLCCVDGRDRILATYYIPATAAHVQTITIMASNKPGKYERYRDALDILWDMVPKD